MVTVNKKIEFNNFVSEIKSHQEEFDLAIQHVLSSGWFILGKEVESFEEEFSTYLNSKYCISVANGLEALQISLMALGIGKGDEVITTPISAVATTLAILAVGATPIFVDTTTDGMLDTDLIDKALTKKTKAILPVHLYGQSANLFKIINICNKHDLFLIEDACQAHGSIYQNKKLGTFGQLGCFSFYPTKNLGAFGDGGAIVTNNTKLMKICKEIRDYGQISKYKHIKYGLNSRLDEIQAAILRIKLKYLDKNNQKRRSLAKKYIDSFSDCPQVEIIKANPLEDNNYHLFVIKSTKRDILQKQLQLSGIQTSIHYPIIIPDQPFFKNVYKNKNFDIARKFVKEILSLPCNPYLEEEDIVIISHKIKEIIE